MSLRMTAAQESQPPIEKEKDLLSKQSRRQEKNVTQKNKNTHGVERRVLKNLRIEFDT